MVKRITDFQRDLFILAGLLGLLGGLVVVAWFYTYDAPEEVLVETQPEKKKKEKPFHLEHHLEDFQLANLHRFAFSNDSMQALIPDLVPVNHTLYSHVFQFSALPKGRYVKYESDPFVNPAQSYFFSRQPTVKMWTGYDFDWITVVFNPQPNSWQVLSCFYNRDQPDNPEIPGAGKGIQGNFTFFPLAEYWQEEDYERVRTSDWLDSTQVRTTLVERYLKNGDPVIDSTITHYNMMVYTKHLVQTDSTWRNGALRAEQDASTLDKPIFLE